MYCELPRKKVFKNQNGLLINQYLIDTIQDISTLPTQISKPAYDRCAAGSTAYCIENQNYYILNNNNEWLVYDENGEGNNNSINKKIENDVTFYDYDGTIVTSYSVSDFMKLDSLPENPDHTDKGLTAQGWNWNLTDAKAYVTKYGKLNVGQMYVPTDGKTHVFINIPEDDPSYETTLYFGHTTASGQTVIDWGDGSPTETVSGESAAEHSHTYANPGRYDVTLDTVNGIMSIVGTDDDKSGTHFSGSGNHARNLTRIEEIRFSTKVSIGSSAFQYCYALQNVTIPDSVTSIGNYAFQYCYALQNVTIPDSVTSIGANAFDNCVALQNITISEGVTSIGSGVFYHCYALQSVTIPDSVTSVGSGAFNSCYALQSVTIPEGVTSIGSYAFQYCYALQSVTISDSVTSIGNSAFDNCYALQNITISEGVTSIENYMFNSCYVLQSVTIPEGVTSIGGGAFNSCYALQSVTIPEGVTSIGGSAFYGCSALQSVTVPESMTSIDGGAFGSCDAIIVYHFKPNTPPTLSDGAFYNISTDTVFYVPAESLEAYKTATNWSTYADRIFAEPE